jgi:hypothetical protein
MKLQLVDWLIVGAYLTGSLALGLAVSSRRIDAALASSP